MKRLKELRESKNMSQQTLADIFHVTQQSIYKYEHGLAEPDLDVILHMADFFDTSVDYLIGYTNTPNRYETYPENAITHDEMCVLEYYRRLSPRAQELIQELIKQGCDTDE
ncbi:MAG: helix-turn-helix transcriptional regulator [Roseburia sp.]|nr:helix-turn-helix transcriptional regulator [Roseburia sp.]